MILLASVLNLQVWIVRGAREHAAGVQWFFKEEIRSHGWRTADLRRYARTLNHEFRGDPSSLFAVAEALFGREALEEKALMDIRTRAARLVLRTACERLPARDRARILATR